MSKPTSDQYAHRFHVGNVADVLKHISLIAMLDALSPSLYIESHAGAGRYKLPPQGEWEGGVGRIIDEASPPPLVQRYLTLVRDVGIWKRGGKVYPGSPNIAQALLPSDARLHLFELADDAQRDLERFLGTDPRVQIEQADGFSGAAQRETSRALLLIDPPYSTKSEWTQAADAVTHAWEQHPSTVVALWYPIVSWTRPNALHARLRERGVAFDALELVTTPIERGRTGLKGSGMLLLRAPESVLGEVLGVLPWLGQRCATQGRFSVRCEHN